MEKHIPFRLMAIFALMALALFMLSCEEEKVVPLDKIVGSWAFESDETPLKFSFDVIQEGNGVHNTGNKIVEYPTLNPAQGDNHNVFLYDKSPNGVGSIEIISRGPVPYLVFAIDCRYNENGDLEIKELIITMPEEDPYSVFNQVLRRH